MKDTYKKILKKIKSIFIKRKMSESAVSVATHWHWILFANAFVLLLFMFGGVLSFFSLDYYRQSKFEEDLQVSVAKVPAKDSADYYVKQYRARATQYNLLLQTIEVTVPDLGVIVLKTEEGGSENVEGVEVEV